MPEVAMWLLRKPDDQLATLIEIALDNSIESLVLLAEVEYEYEEREREAQEREQHEKRAERRGEILCAIDAADYLAVGLRRELKEFFHTHGNDIEYAVSFDPIHLRNADSSRHLLPPVFFDELQAIYSRYSVLLPYDPKEVSAIRPDIVLGGIQWDDSDLARNNIMSNLVDEQTKQPETMKEFLTNVVDAKRPLFVKSHDNRSKGLLAWLYTLVEKSIFEKYFDIQEGGDDTQLESSREELLLLCYGLVIATPRVVKTREPEGRICKASEFYQNAVWVSPLVDQVWQPDIGYNRNVKSPYPITFKLEKQKELCHYHPVADIKVSGLIGKRQYLKFVCESKPTSNDTSVHGRDTLKLCWIGFHNLYHALYKQKEEVRQSTTFPSMLHTNGKMNLFLCGFCGTERVHFFSVRDYDCGNVRESLKLMHNLLNLRDHSYGLEALSDEEKVQNILVTTPGNTLSSRYTTRNSSGCQKRARESTDGESGSTNRLKRPRRGAKEIPSSSFLPDIDEYISFLQDADVICQERGIEIETTNGTFEMIPANRKTRAAIRQGQEVMLKFIQRHSSELFFLQLLSSSDLWGQPGNKTVELLDHFAVNDELDCLVLPRVIVFDSLAAAKLLTAADLVKLAHQVREYAAFLASKGLVHRDLKLENVGFRTDGNGSSAGDLLGSAELVVLDLGRMEWRRQSEIVDEYFVPREYCPPEFSCEGGCSPFVMDA
ncbi:hypothetical protein HK405_009707, partial [Cladochytrium tenue]